MVVKQLIKKCRVPPGIPNGVQMPRAMTKRKRDADKNLVYLRQLMCIPSVSEGVAKKLQERFGSLPALQEALADVVAEATAALETKIGVKLAPHP